MKYIILLGDGMADQPIDELGGMTPLEYASTPNMDRIASQGILCLINTVPKELQPGSDVANLSILGYNPIVSYTGRGPIEAASLGIDLSPRDIAFRCNLVTLSDSEDPIMDDFTAGHITSAEAKIIIEDLMAELGSDEFCFYPGVGYRHVLVWRNGENNISTTAPHDIIGKKVNQYLPVGHGADKIRFIMQSSKEILRNHPINIGRQKKGEKQATSIWLWGQGLKPQLPKMTELYKFKGGMISAVDLLNGIGIFAGLEVIKVKGATGYIDTNYYGKAEKALEALRELDFIFVHVESPDEMGHEGNLEGKIRAIEDFDSKVVGTILSGISGIGHFRIAVLSDHPTPINIRTHINEPSPIAILCSERMNSSKNVHHFNEKSAKLTNKLIDPGYIFMKHFVGDFDFFSDPK